MSARVTDEIAEAVKQHHGRPLRPEDASGQPYYVLTSQQFRDMSTTIVTSRPTK